MLEGLSETIALEQQAAGRSTIAVTSTNAAAQQINHVVYERLVDAGVIDPAWPSVELSTRRCRLPPALRGTPAAAAPTPAVRPLPGTGCRGGVRGARS